MVAKAHKANEVQRRLEERPRFTLRLRIALVFVVFALLITAITVGSILMLSRLRTKMEFLEAADECAFQIQEARRYEKNFFLYGTSLVDALDHIYRAHRLLEQHVLEVQKLLGDEAARRWLENLQHYERLLEELADPSHRARLDESARRRSEAGLRRYGAATLDEASNLIVKERLSMNAMIRTAMWIAGVSLAFMVLLMVALSYQLARQVIGPIGRFIRYVERIAEGDFSPIRPARPYRDEFSTLAVAINRMLDELKTRQEQLVQSRKMAAVGTLTSGIAHELNNPLNNISLTVEALLDDFEETEDADKKQLLKDMFTQVQRAGATVRNLLDFTRKDQPVFTTVSIPDVLESTLKLVRNELTLAKVDAHLDVAPDLPLVCGNPRNLQQVFLNLFLNAMQAMPKGGQLHVGARVQDGTIRVAVQDSGTGIPQKDLEKIFEPFYTTKQSGEGTGLGLSVSYTIVEKHGGRLEVDTREGEGSTFYVTLPIRRECH